MGFLRSFWFLWLGIVAIGAGLALGTMLTNRAKMQTRGADAHSQVFSAVPSEQVIATVAKVIESAQTEILISAKTLGSGKIVKILLAKSTSGVRVHLLLSSNSANEQAVEWLRGHGFVGDFVFSQQPVNGQVLLVDGCRAITGAFPWEANKPSADPLTVFTGEDEVVKWRVAWLRSWQLAGGHAL
jgi:hypothetical protein